MGAVASVVRVVDSESVAGIVASVVGVVASVVGVVELSVTW